MADAPTRRFLEGPLRRVYAATALPIIFVMGMNGVLAVTDALFLGWFVGPEALAAVTLMFPAYMVLVALSTLVANGMSSILARRLGAGAYTEAQATFAGAHGLALCMSAGLCVLFVLFGRSAVQVLMGGSPVLTEMGLTYLKIVVFCSPLFFVLAVNGDALRNEGRVGLMAGISVLISLANIAFNLLLIGRFGMGVAGSAYGTALAQALALSIVLGFRIYGPTRLRPSALWRYSLATGWGRILALGAPQSLNFTGLALGSLTIVLALQFVGPVNGEATLSAYGIVTRVLTFAFLPLLGLSHAMQTITGNNFGAQNFPRVDASLKFAVMAAALYCVLAQLIFNLFATQIGRVFVDSPLVASEVGRILPTLTACFFLSGPLMLIAAHFQAIGDAARAALLSLAKPYGFAVPLTVAFAVTLGEPGIWMAGPTAEALLLGLTGLVLVQTARTRPLRWGLFGRATGERT